MAESISFDRAATSYDATRSLPTDISGAINAALLSEIKRADATRVLEIGIGTGRIARPLLAAGVPMTGVDISRKMMERLREQLPVGEPGPGLILGDATRLPFKGDSFGVIMTVHVLHLVASVEAVGREIRRLLAAGGVFLNQTRRPDDDFTEHFWVDTDHWWTDALAARGFQRRRRPTPADIRETLESLGGRLRIQDIAGEVYSHTLAEEYEDIRGRVHSWTWEIPHDLLDSVLSDFEAWMTTRYGPPSSEHTDRVVYELEAWTWD